jgi:hypothetical protein
LTNAVLPACPHCHGIDVRRGEVIIGVSYRPGAPLPRQPQPTKIIWCGFCHARTATTHTWEQAKALWEAREGLCLPLADPYGRGMNAIN